ncbi:MAG: radical SAM protein [Spirochaetaceae bacterium]|nr:MAG: radical SAM protein [Spirochaetaceae bacterium]
MNSLICSDAIAFYRRTLSRFYVTADALELSPVERAVGLLEPLHPQVVASLDEIPNEHRNLRSIFVTSFRGEPLAPCPGTRLHQCCNYHTVDLYAGCPLGCSYCIMQSYRERTPVTVYADPAPAIAAIRRQALDAPDRILRVGTGETGDSLLYDPLFDVTRRYIVELADLPNVHFEAKTKTDWVDHLLSVEPKGNAVIGFSLNADEASAEEGKSAPLARRLAAAVRAVAAGYRVAVHFDPLFRLGDLNQTETHYASVVARLAAAVPAERIAWISLGTVRYPPALRDHIHRPYMLDEFVVGVDGKYRYLQRERVAIYQAVVRTLCSALAPVPPIYLCMESEAVWRRVFGATPQSIPALSAIFDGAFVRGVERSERREEEG